MRTSIRSILIILVVSITAMWVIKKISPIPRNPDFFKNRFGISFTLVVYEDRELHKLYKRASINFLKNETSVHNDHVLSMKKPNAFYLSNEELKPDSFSEFIAETDYTFDYYFNQSRYSNDKEETLTISRQDAQSLANWLSDKERVSYQIVDSREFDYACKYFLQDLVTGVLVIYSDKLERICLQTSVDNLEKYAQSDGFRLIRDVE
jgi:hypothetical protein